VVQPLIGPRECDLMPCDSSNDRWVGASDPTWIWEVLRQTPIQQIEYPLFF
jgi:hypothetical protein